MTGRQPTNVWVIGTCEGLPELVHALGHQNGVHVLGTSDDHAQAVAALDGGEVDVVLHGTDAGAGWLDELTAIREYSAAPIVLLSSSRDGLVLDEALESGVAEALLLPQLVENVAFAVRRASRSGGRATAEAPEPAGNRLVTVFSPKGGIGKTVTATNLAAMIAKEEGQRTLLVDLDLQFGDTAIVLGVEPEKTLHDLVTAPGELDAEKLAGYTTHHESGLDILPAPLRPQDADLVSDAKLARLLEVARGSYDVIVVDTAPFLHGAILTALDQTTDLLLICSPEVPALKDVHLSLSTLALLGFPKEKVRLVVNHAHMNAGLKRSEVEGALGMKVTAEIPNDRLVSDSVNRGMPVVLLDGKADFTHALRVLSATLRSAEAPVAASAQSRRGWLPQLGKARR